MVMVTVLSPFDHTGGLARLIAAVSVGSTPLPNQYSGRHISYSNSVTLFTLSAAALALTAVLWVLHGTNQMIWTTAMVVSLTPLFIAVILLTAQLPQLHSLKLAGLQAQTRETPDVVLPTSPSVALPLVTEFAAGAHENFIDAADVSDLVGTSSTPSPSGEGRSASPGPSSEGRLMTMPSRPVA
jgi:hypothetical protein